MRRLRAPAHDAEALAGVLRDPQIGGFDVRTMLNEPAYVISEAVEEFFADRSPNDLLLVHFSCHGVKDESGDLYFATVNTKLSRLSATAVAADFVNRLMNRSRSRRIVLLLDCCYAGAFERGMTARADTTVGIGEQFGGRGRAVITASSAMEYAFEGDQPLGAFDVAPSVFTGALVEGLTSGEADRDQDGWVTLDELYDYIFDKVREATPHQTPGKWTFGVQGDLRIARRGRPVTTPVQLPPELRQAIDHPLASIRGAVVKELQRLMASDHPGLALSARLNLQRLADDDSRIVAAAARAVLGIEARPAGPVPPRLEPSASVDATPITDSETRPPEKTSDPRTMRAPEAEEDVRAWARLVRRGSLREVHRYPGDLDPIRTRANRRAARPPSLRQDMDLHRDRIRRGTDPDPDQCPPRRLGHDASVDGNVCHGAPANREDHLPRRLHDIGARMGERGRTTRW
ncbi:caspase domain-containing protein [Streptosporangium lutulentum]